MCGKSRKLTSHQMRSTWAHSLKCERCDLLVRAWDRQLHVRTKSVRYKIWTALLHCKWLTFIIFILVYLHDVGPDKCFHFMIFISTIFLSWYQTFLHWTRSFIHHKPHRNIHTYSILAFNYPERVQLRALECVFMNKSTIM